jgi:uncharacterized protein YbjT (DUF2867 family)
MEDRISLVTVTGSSGTIGTELVRLLSAAGAPTRAVVRDARKARAVPHVAWLQADLSNPYLLEPALAGTRRLFLLTGNDQGFGGVQRGIVHAAEVLGVEHMVKASALGASDHSKSWIGREHWEVEQAIQRSGMRWTMLRPHAFMQNWLGDLAESVKTEGVIYSPIGDGRVPFIDARDIAAVAAEVLVHPEAHAGKKYVLTGGEAVGYADLAAALTTVTGRAISYRPISMDEARARMVASGASPESVDAVLAIAAYQKEGGPTATVSPTVQRLLGRPPRSIGDFVRDNAERFSVS